MGKRFGRNQKRKLKSEIETLKQQLQGFKFTLKSQNEFLKIEKQKSASLEGVVGFTAEVLGKNFISLPAKDTITHYANAADNLRVMLPDREGYRYSQPLKIADTVKNCVAELELHKAQACFDDLYNMVHMRYHSPEGEVRYSMSRMAWENLSNDALLNILHKEISRSMANVILELREERLGRLNNG